MNNIVLVGRLVADPELRHTTTGKAVCSFRLAVDQAYKDAEGNKKTDFFTCQVWGKPAETLALHVSKGRELAVSGSMQQRSYETREGGKRTTYEVNVAYYKFIGSSKSSGQTEPQQDLGRDEDEALPF